MWESCARYRAQQVSINRSDKNILEQTVIKVIAGRQWNWNEIGVCVCVLSGESIYYCHIIHRMSSMKQRRYILVARVWSSFCTVYTWIYIKQMKRQSINQIHFSSFEYSGLIIILSTMKSILFFVPIRVIINEQMNGNEYWIETNVGSQRVWKEIPMINNNNKNTKKNRLN